MTQETTAVLRYPGGKSKALKKISCLIPRDINEYREPFVGGGSVFVKVKQNIEEDVSFKINDINPDLYLFWRCVQQDGERFREKVFSMKNEFKTGKELYEYYKKSHKNLDNFEKAIRFFILNRITFSGLIDSGGFSQQSYDKRFTESMINKITPLSELLSDVIISNYDYSHLLHETGKDVFLFLDPPYLSAKESSLYGKNGDLHKVFDHRKFADEVRKCSHKWLITCDDTPEMRDLFDFAEIIPWSLNYGMTNVKKSTVTKGNEIFVLNYNLEDIDPISKNFNRVFTHC
ncbi:DNA adenine methylase [Methanolacinia paynteri]|uniref:DNA adenine methylase n=1 Tax=Methanolacinia paynteri TaxID=230356 RepID=UPI00064E286E|nr:DNA adenine methylase [Methanolacinia paynteri]